MNNFDIGIVGAGVAGAFAAFKLSKDYKNSKVILFDTGRPPLKRRRQLEGWLGCLPNSDGKLYLNDSNNVADLVGNRRFKKANTFFNKTLENIGDFKITKDKPLSANVEKKLKKFGFEYYTNDYVQIYPKDIHALSKYMSEYIESQGNITFSFDNDISTITKQKNMFIITNCENQEFKCKKIILSTGRSGWRWVKNIYSHFGIIDNNDITKFGLRIECNANIMKDFNKSNCTILKDKELEIGPLCWNGTVIPEDHVDLAISAFRSNENRWKSDKVSFNLIGNRYNSNNGFEQTDRMGRLAFVLSDDRIIKERVSTLMNSKSKISCIKEYDWLKETIPYVANIIPDINKAYYHIPTIIPTPPKINIGNNLESEVEGMFVVGENAGINGILAAATMGIIAAECINK